MLEDSNLWVCTVWSCLIEFQKAVVEVCAQLSTTLVWKVQQPKGKLLTTQSRSIWPTNDVALSPAQLHHTHTHSLTFAFIGLVPVSHEEPDISSSAAAPDCSLFCFLPHWMKLKHTLHSAVWSGQHNTRVQLFCRATDRFQQKMINQCAAHGVCEQSRFIFQSTDK